MSKTEAPLNALSDFLPPGSYPLVEPFLIQYKVHLTVTRSRSTVLGDYRNAHGSKAHRISINGNLNRYAFLITLLHELAHLITFIRFGHKVAAHGREWKQQFGELLKHLLLSAIFPEDIKTQLAASLQNPAASSCADLGLMRVLRKYDAKKDGVVLVEELVPGETFHIKGGRLFRRGEKVRTRIKAIEIKTGKVYLFSPVYEVIKHAVSDLS
ncbi:MAG: SprT-like domain-containing protein [bacterium]|jgi:SprT protein